MAKKKKKKKSKTARKKVKEKVKKNSVEIKKQKVQNQKSQFLKYQKNGPTVHISTKVNMKKNINYQLKIMKVFGKKKENELIGSNLIQK